MGWVIIESFPKNSEDLAFEKTKWENVAEDMALIPERNVQLREDGDIVHLEVSEELDSCMKGF